jgi:hypothetical protein
MVREIESVTERVRERSHLQDRGLERERVTES